MLHCQRLDRPKSNQIFPRIVHTQGLTRTRRSAGQQRFRFSHLQCVFVKVCPLFRCGVIAGVVVVGAVDADVAAVVVVIEVDFVAFPIAHL